ncbi:TPA: hydrogenase expression/formation protein HypE, partial [Candidatus Sumerlaeota bacterium]|nr:hydrogenase expression/formation protein HypE [Candidatus Sumerlaeota bacterium]
KSHIQPGDAVFITGRIAEHGLAVMSVREGLEFETEIRSDAAPLGGLANDLLSCGANIRFMRDPTRGGLAGLLADLSEETALTV